MNIDQKIAKILLEAGIEVPALDHVVNEIKEALYEENWACRS